MIRIEMQGSFLEPGRSSHLHTESATVGGHAAAVGRAIEFLTSQLPTAIQKDHYLHSRGQVPPDADYGFGKSK
jgi:hypothetical protein